MNSGAIRDAGRMLVDAMRKPDGSYRTYREMVAEGIPTEYQGHFDIVSQKYVNLDFNSGLGSNQPSL